MKPHKFHAKPQRTEDGFFASKAELKRWKELLILQGAGRIRDLERQPKFPLWTVDLTGKRVEVKIGNRRAYYIADFAFHDSDGTYVVEDVKGMDTAISALKRAIVKASLGINITLITRGKKREPARPARKTTRPRLHPPLQNGARQ